MGAGIGMMAGNLGKATGTAATGGFPWMEAILGGIGLFGGLGADDREGDLYKKLLGLSEKGVGVDKLVAPELGGINKTFAEGLTQRMKGLFSQGLGGSGVLTDEVPIGFTESKNYATGQAYGNAFNQNEQIKSNALKMMSGMDLGGNEIFGQLAGYGGYNMLKHLFN